MKFIITVDVEADNQWATPAPKTINNVYSLDRFHELAKKYGFKPSYLVTYEVASDDKAVSMLKSWQDKHEAEVGAHFHPWTTPPIGELDKFKRFPSELGEEELKQKLVSLTTLIKQKMGKWPTSYRAGRWGFDERQERILFELGYKVDCSVSPKVSWESEKKGPGASGPDWRKESATPRQLPSGLVELPMTVLNTGILGRRKSRWADIFSGMESGFSKRVLNKLLFKQKWLRVFPETSPKDLLAVYQSAKAGKLPILEFMIHSSELVSGSSPYVKNQIAEAGLYRNLEYLFSHMRSENIEGSTLSDFADEFKKESAA